jgi:hypothetical protein
LEAVRARFGVLSAKVREPEIARHDGLGGSVVFSEVPSWRDYFAGLREHREILLELFINRVSRVVTTEVERAPKPLIAIHLRRGDFRPLRSGEDFARTGGTRTPDEYFVQTIEALRAKAGWEIPVTVFSDGTDEECSRILGLGGVSRAPSMADIGHVILMSKAKIIVPSAGSTFSLWSGFLSESTVIHHPAHFRVATRPATINAYAFEGAGLMPGQDLSAALSEVLRNLRST